LAPGRASSPENFAPKCLVMKIKGQQPANPGLAGKIAVKAMCVSVCVWVLKLLKPLQFFDIVG